MTPFRHIGKRASSYRGACRVPLYNYSVCPSVAVCVTFVGFIYCDSCTRLTSTNPEFMEASQYGLTRRTCLVARGLEVVAVAALMWISWCGFGAWDFVLFSSSSESTHHTAPVAIRETEHPGRRTHNGFRGTCSDALDPVGEVRGCSVGCTIVILGISLLIFIAGRKSIGVS